MSFEYTNDIPQDFPVESFGHREYNTSDAQFIHNSGDEENSYSGESVAENRQIDREIRLEYRRSDKDYNSRGIVPEYVSSSTGTNVNSFKYVETPEELPIDEIPDYDYEDSVPQGNTNGRNYIQKVCGQKTMLDMHQKHAGLSNTAFEGDFSVNEEVTVPEVYKKGTHLNHKKGVGNAKILNDGSKTFVFRKKTVPADTVSHQSTLKWKSVIPEGYVPSHKENVLTLKDKIKLLRKQNTLHGVVDVFREKILDDAEIDLEGFAGWRHKRSEKCDNFKQHLKNIAAVLEPWAGSFKTIEGRFGTAIMNYFRFIRWLMFMNLYMVIIMLGAILVPHYILENTVFNETDITNYCTERYNKHVKNFTEYENIGSQVLDVLQGTGWMEQTILFYGVYQNKTILDHDATYNMSLAYLLAMGSCFCISFVLIVRNSGKGLKEGVMNKDSTVNQFVNKVFCGGWDFCISEQKAAKRRHKNFSLELQGDLETQRLIWRKQSRTLKDKCRLYSIRTVINVFVVVALCGSLYLIFFTNDQMLELQNRSKELGPVVQALIQYMPSITITLLNVIVPVIFNKIVLFEDYTPTFEIRITLLRIILLRLASLGILIGSLYRIIAVKESHFLSNCGNNRWDRDNITNDSTIIMCWETYVGQQIYKLIIMDFLVGVISVILMEFPRRIIYQKFHKTSKLVKIVGQQEFDLPKVVLDIVYSQTLCWMGMFFCPLTPILAFLKCFIFFYVRKVSLLQNCVQPVRPYRTSRSNSLFAAVLFLSFLLSTVPLAYLVNSFQPSQSCGPFRKYEGEDYVFFGTVTNLIETWPSTARDVFVVVGSSTFMVPAILLVCSVMYGYWASKGASQRQAELLQEELTQIGRDKQFLVAQVNEILHHLE